MDGAAILLDNAMDDSESKPCANAHRFGRIERIEDMRLDIEGDSAAVIADLNT